MTEKFWSLVDRSGSCWPWTGPKHDEGYGLFHYGRRRLFAHRVAVELSRGTIPRGMVIDHVCRNRACVNPSHLDVVTNAENVLRGEGITARNLLKVSCPSGHPYDDQNTRRDKYGFRSCKTCELARCRRRRAAAKLGGRHE